MGDFDRNPTDAQLWTAYRKDSPERRACPDPQETAAYLDGRLEGTAQEAFERHLARCSFCFETAAVVRDVQSAARVVDVPLWERAAKGLVAAALILGVSLPGFALGSRTFVLDRNVQRAASDAASFGLWEDVR